MQIQNASGRGLPVCGRALPDELGPALCSESDTYIARGSREKRNTNCGMWHARLFGLADMESACVRSMTR
jgi:hypothetical protein